MNGNSDHLSFQLAIFPTVGFLSIWRPRKCTPETSTEANKNYPFPVLWQILSVFQKQYVGIIFCRRHKQESHFFQVQGFMPVSLQELMAKCTQTKRKNNFNCARIRLSSNISHPHKQQINIKTRSHCNLNDLIRSKTTQFATGKDRAPKAIPLHYSNEHQHLAGKPATGGRQPYCGQTSNNRTTNSEHMRENSRETRTRFASWWAGRNAASRRSAPCRRRSFLLHRSETSGSCIKR